MLALVDLQIPVVVLWIRNSPSNVDMGPEEPELDGQETEKERKTQSILCQMP